MNLENALRGDIAEIRRGSPAAQSIRHNMARWEVLANAPTTATAWAGALTFLGVAAGTADFSISRQDLFDAVAHGVNVETRFLLDMIWGYGPDQGNAPDKVQGYFSTLGLDDLLAGANADLSNGRPDRAFRKLRKVKALGTSYVTKVLYFEGRHTVTPYPVIFDNRVAGSLVRLALDNDDQWVQGCTVNQRGNTAKAYRLYCENMHDMANKLRVETDQLELYLFGKP